MYPINILIVKKPEINEFLLDIFTQFCSNVDVNWIVSKILRNESKIDL